MSFVDEEIFIIVPDHLRLMRKWWVRWDGDEYGAPAIDSKRPYGNSSVEEDIGEVLGWAWDMDKPMPSDLRTMAAKLHRETEAALQICLQLGEFRTGTFHSPKYSSQWSELT